MTVKELRRLLRKIPANSAVFVQGGGDIIASFAQNERGEWAIELKLRQKSAVEPSKASSSARTPQEGSEEGK